MSEMERYATYDSTGRIVGVLSCPAGMGEANIRLNTSLPAIKVPCLVSPEGHFVSDGTVRDRPQGLARLKGRTLLGVPAGAAVTIEGSKYLADGTDIELHFSAPGRYRVLVSLWPYLEQEFIVENPA